MRNILVGGKYRHFKGHHYKVLALAEHTETGEEYVVYQDLYGKGKIYVRPLYTNVKYFNFRIFEVIL